MPHVNACWSKRLRLRVVHAAILVLQFMVYGFKVQSKSPGIEDSYSSCRA